MKKLKKHHFTHHDPEGVRTVDINMKEDDKTSVKVKAPSDNLSFIKRDLKKTALLISLFLVLLIILYVIQSKTNLLAPVLRLFGL